MIVVDASALLEALLGTPAAEVVEGRLFAAQQTLLAPHLVDVEVAHVVRRYTAAGEIDDERGRTILADLAEFPLLRYRHDFLLRRVWQLRSTPSACGAVCVALTGALDAPLITRDVPLGRCARPPCPD